MKRAPMKKRSLIWEYFDISRENEKFAICLLCRKQISRGGEGKRAGCTSAMCNHLKSKHPDKFVLLYKDKAHLIQGKSSPSTSTDRELMYNLLLLTKEHQEPLTDSISSDTEELDVKTGNHDAENFIRNDAESYVEQTMPCIVKLEPTSDEDVYVPEAKTSKKRTFVDEPVEVCSTTVSSKNEGISEFEAVGVNVAKKLAKMEPIQALYAESLISIILRKGLLNQLEENTNICSSGGR